MSSHLWWYLSRAAGMVAYAMLTGSVLAGAVLSSDLFTRSRRPKWLLDIHRGLAGLAMWFMAGHVLALLGDSYLELTPVDLLVPFAASWHRGAMALGVIAMWGLVAVQLTSLQMSRIPRSTWKWIHLSSYLMFAMAALHGTFAGSDATQPLYVAGSLAAVAAVMAAAIYRVLQRRSRNPRRSVQAGSPPR